MPEQLQHILEQAGTPHALDGHTVLYLDRPDHYWLVTAGTVEVFYGEGTREQPGGRTFLLSRSAGQLLGSMAGAASAAGLMLLARGIRARLVALPRSRLESLLRDPAYREAGTLLLEQWVEELASCLNREAPASRFKTLMPGEAATLGKAEIAYPGADICWVRPTSGLGRLMGYDALSAAPPEVVPLTRNVWIQAVDPDTRLDVLATRDLIEQSAALAALDTFHQKVLQHIRDDTHRAAVEERERLHAKVELDGRTLQHALSSLTGILDPAEDTSTFAGTDSNDPLLAACQLIGREIGVVMQAPPADRPGKKAGDPVLAIAQASKVRTREVILRDDWWRHDQGPLLGFLQEEDERPVALLQAAPERYVLHDLVLQRSRPVTPEVAALLKPLAYMFIAPFATDVVTQKDLWRFGMRGLRRDGRVMALAGLATGLLGLITPILSKVLFDEVIPLADRTQLLEISLLLFAVVVVAAGFELTRGIALLRLEARVEMNVEAAMMDRLLRLPTAFFKRYQAGDLSERVLGISTIRRTLTNTALTAVLTGIFSTVNLGLLFYYDVTLALLGLVLAGAAVSVIIGSGVYALRFNRQLVEREGLISGMLFQVMSGISKLRVAGAERRVFALWAEQFAVQKKLAYKAGTVQNNFEIFNAAYPILTSMAFFGVVYITMQSGMASGMEALTTGTFIAIITAFSQFLTGVLGMGLAIISALEVVPLYERAKPVFEAPLEVRSDSADPGTLNGEIEINHVTFRYEANGPIILNDVSLHVKPGEMVALVGPSGSGKSTLLRLLLGLEQPASGTLYFDGQDLASLDIEAVRRQIGVVLQHDSLMPANIYKNIVGTSSVLTLEDAWEAARMTGLEDDINAMPMGMHTGVNEGGNTFSGGQRQRLMIARAIVHKPRILLFDEATSALDNRTQRAVSDSLERLHVTRIVIAHRLSTIRQADRIYVLEGGRVVEEGSYETLLEQDGPFAALSRRQMV